MTDTPDLPPNRLALVLDGQVLDVLQTDDRLAAIFLSEPTIIDVSAVVNDHDVLVMPGDLYDAETGAFAYPDQEITFTPAS